MKTFGKNIPLIAIVVIGLATLLPFLWQNDFQLNSFGFNRFEINDIRVAFLYAIAIQILNRSPVTRGILIVNLP